MSFSPAPRLSLMLLAFPLIMACSSATPEPAAPSGGTPTVDVAPGAAAPGDAQSVATDSASSSSGGAKSTDVAGSVPAAMTTAALPPVKSSPPPVKSGPPAPGGGPDQDFDGIADTSDMCPDMPEDRDGFQDLDGCPEPDNDKDGIDDMNDKCPNEPETKNGKQDLDGCPD